MVQKQTAIERLLRRLRSLRMLHSLTQEGFAEKSGISYKYYQAIEAGRKRELRLSTLERLARAYGLQIHELLAPETRGERAMAEKSHGYQTDRAKMKKLKRS